MKKKSLVSLVLSSVMVLMSALPAVADTTEANYSSVIPDSLRVEMAASAYRSFWSVINSRGKVTVDDKAMSNETLKNLMSAKAISWSGAGDTLRVGRLKNTFSVAPFVVQANGNYATYEYTGAAKIGIKNSDAKDAGFSAVVAKRKLRYNEADKKPEWGGYNSTIIDDANTNKIMSGYSTAPTYSSAGIPIDFSSGNPYLAVGIAAEDNVDLDNTYISVWTMGVGGTNNNVNRAVTGVKLSKYYSESDKGQYKEIAIPLSDFDVKNDWVISEYYNNDGNVENLIENPAANFGNGQVIGSGIMREYVADQEDAANNYSVYITKMQFLKVEAPSNLKVQSFADSGSSGYGETLTFAPSTYNDVTAYEISMNSKAGNKLFSKIVPVDNLIKNADGTLSYTHGVISESGSIYSVAAVAEETVGNEDIGYSPVKSTAITATTRWDAGSQSYNQPYTFKYMKNSSDNIITVINRCFYNCNVLVARYDSTGTVLKQCDIFDPLSQVIKTTYSTPIGDDKVAVFIWSDEEDCTPLAGVATVANTNVSK